MKCDICGFNAKSIRVHFLKKHPDETMPNMAREREQRSLKQLFGFPVKETYEVIKKRESACVQGDPDYVFPEKQTQQLLLMLRRERNNHTYIFGPSGSGKSQLAINVADKLNWPLCRLNGDSYLTRSNLIGKMTVVKGETKFQDNLVPMALRFGWILMIDEYDTLNPIAANVLKPLLEKFPRLVITEDNGRVVEAHPDFRVIATANTAGRGDDTGMFVNTHTQSIADLRRFSAFIEMNFPDKDEEKKIIRRKFEKLEELSDTEIKNFCEVTHRMREAYKAGKLDRTFSPAETLNWVETYIELSNAREAANLSFLNAYHSESKIAVTEIINQIFGHA